LKSHLDSIEVGMNKQQEELMEMLTKQGIEHKDTLQRVEDTLHNIITFIRQEKIEREKVNSENVDIFNRIMERLEQITPQPSPISSREVPGISLLGNTSNPGFQDRDYQKIKKECEIDGKHIDLKELKEEPKIAHKNEEIDIKPQIQEIVDEALEETMKPLMEENEYTQVLSL
jgi:hypothetical protein